ncbi:MAG: RNA pseudouridine synthase [Saprospiraceae bacterium]|nr:RNA pseudouridine synthase [Saprospiraceae bacterium]
MIRKFSEKIQFADIPANFQNPFSYDICKVAIVAAKELQSELEKNDDMGIDSTTKSELGKMYGVLVVVDHNNEPGYLAAFSGKLDKGNVIERFVPPICDLLNPAGFFKKGESEINEINRKIQKLEQDKNYVELINELKINSDYYLKEIENLKSVMQTDKLKRLETRKQAILLVNNIEQKKILAECENESIRQHFQMKDLKRKAKADFEAIKDKLKTFSEKIENLKFQRKILSAELQGKIFEEYVFLNSRKEEKSLNQIFNLEKGVVPPSGAGECAAPKLLQYAFQNHLRVISMVEFWWGKSPDSEIRKHRNFYPPCRSKCWPILSHMLSEFNFSDHELTLKQENIEIPVLYEDADIIVINKPSGLLSVPGLMDLPSVYSVMKYRFPNLSGPIIIHRLDQSTSGLMILAKNMTSYKLLQSQFINRIIKKSYTAILDGELVNSEGCINLPIRVDLKDRPRQLVCFEMGKEAITEYKVIHTGSGQTRLMFFPRTGRTHQLRVHSAHPRGLGIPIQGDELYGKKADRLKLHASKIEFRHPCSQDIMVFESKPDF